MAKKRDKQKESIFVTNEYFEKCGITRQVVRYSIEKERIKPAGSLVAKSVIDTISQVKTINSTDGFLKSPYLYYQRDADFFILLYWIDNYKRYLNAIYDTWEKLKEKEIKKNTDNRELKKLLFDLLEGNGQREELPSYILEFKEIVSKYFYFNTRRPTREEDEFYREFCREYKKGISQRNERFFYSNKSVDAFMIKDSKNKFQGKEHRDIMEELLKLNNEAEIRHGEEKKYESIQEK